MNAETVVLGALNLVVIALWSVMLGRINRMEGKLDGIPKDFYSVHKRVSEVESDLGVTSARLEDHLNDTRRNRRVGDDV